MSRVTPSPGILGERSKTIGVIPARLESVRLPGKVLLDIAGKPLLVRVFEAARTCPELDEVWVASDSRKVIDLCQGAGIPCMVTGKHVSGSDRVHEVLERTDGEFYVNVQGDEPTLRPEQISGLIRILKQGSAEVSTLMVRIPAQLAADPNVVKVVTDHRGFALYFSRAAIPCDRDRSGTAPFYRHIGIYAYRRRALQSFHFLPPSSLEMVEKLEQLRLLQNGIPVAVVETDSDTIGVDTLEDLERAREYFRHRDG